MTATHTSTNLPRTTHPTFVRRIRHIFSFFHPIFISFCESTNSESFLFFGLENNGGITLECKRVGWVGGKFKFFLLPKLETSHSTVSHTAVALSCRLLLHPCPHAASFLPAAAHTHTFY